MTGDSWLVGLVTKLGRKVLLFKRLRILFIHRNKDDFSVSEDLSLVPSHPNVCLCVIFPSFSVCAVLMGLKNSLPQNTVFAAWEPRM